MSGDEERWGPPIPPEQPDDVFTQMAKLFGDCWSELSDAIVHLDTDHGCKEYIRNADLEEMQKRYIEIMKQYQEQLFAQPVQAEGKEQ